MLTKFNRTYPSFMDEFFGRDSYPADYQRNGFKSLPAVNITESEDAYTIEVAAPGLNKKDFKIDLDKNSLTIVSVREDKQEENKEEDHYIAHQPYLVAVIGDAEKCFHHARILVPLDAVHGRIEDKQNAGREQIIVQPFRIRHPAPSQQPDKQDEKKKAQSQSQENYKPPPEDVKSVVSKKYGGCFEPVHSCPPCLLSVRPISHT